MAKKTAENEELIVDVQEVYSNTETFIDENKNAIIGVVVAIAVIIGGYFAYSNFVLGPKQEEAQKEMFMAEKYFGMDSMNLAISGNANFMGFIEIADEYSGTKAGNLANYYLGIAFLRNGEFESAIEALNQFDGEDEMLGTIALGAQGDAYMELGDLEKAASYYKKAANNKNNEFTAPLYLMKAGKTYELLNDKESALDIYTKIKEDYKKSPEASEIDRYIARTEAI